MALFHRPFNVLRVIIDASNDDQVLETAGDEEFSIPEKSQIARAQEWAFATAGQISLEGPGSILGPVPVSLGQAAIGNPNLAHLMGQTSNRSLGIHNYDPGFAYCLTATHQRAHTLWLRGFDHQIVALERS